jgi:hypothetical protein
MWGLGKRLDGKRGMRGKREEGLQIPPYLPTYLLCNNLKNHLAKEGRRKKEGGNL